MRRTRAPTWISWPHTSANMRESIVCGRGTMNSGDSHFYYGVYYVAQALFQLGGNYWQSYRPKLHDLLLRRSPPNSDGGWLGGGGDGAAFGSSYSTAMAVLALAVEYRFLPIYQRFEEPKERDGRE